MSHSDVLSQINAMAEVPCLVSLKESVILPGETGAIEVDTEHNINAIIDLQRMLLHDIARSFERNLASLLLQFIYDTHAIGWRRSRSYTRRLRY